MNSHAKGLIYEAIGGGVGVSVIGSATSAAGKPESNRDKNLEQPFIPDESDAKAVNAYRQSRGVTAWAGQRPEQAAV